MDVMPATARQLLARTARAQREGRVPSLAAGVVRDGGLAWYAGRGAVDGRPPDDRVQYRIGSITKTLTAVLVMRLRDEGLLTLDDPVGTHVPGTPYGGRTVGQLLSHLAGATAESPGDWWERTPGVPWPELAQRLDERHVVLPAGRRFHYSNLGYGLLGELVAAVRGRPWAEVLRDEVLAPLGMTRTTTRPVAPHATGYAVHPWADVVLPEPEHDAVAMAPAGQLWASLADLAAIGAFLLGDTGDVLQAGTLEEMTVPAGVDGAAQEWAAYGLGVQVARVDGRTLVGHGGSMPGFLAGVYADREEGIAAVALANATSGLDPRLLVDLLATVRAAEPAVGEEWRPATAEPEALELAGPWYWGTTVTAMRVRADGMLDLRPVGAGSRASRFRRGADGRWTGLDGYYAGETLTVHRDAAGAVVAFDVATLTFTRAPYDPGAPVPGGVASGWGDLPDPAAGPGD